MVTKKKSTSKSKTSKKSATRKPGKKLATKGKTRQASEREAVHIHDTEHAHAAHAEGQEHSQPAKPRKVAPPPPPRSPKVPGTYLATEGRFCRWRIVDATGQRLGRLSSWIAQALMGKDKAVYSRSVDTGDFIIVVNAEKVVLTGKKLQDKVYQRHTNYPGGLKTTTPQQLLETHPERLVQLAVYRMLPKGHMGMRWFKKLRVFAGPDHPHAAQKPEPVTLPNLGY